MSEYSTPVSADGPTAPFSPPIAGGRPDHSVHFYEDDASLFRTVADFLTAGLVAGQPVAVVATTSHAEAIADALTGRGVDVAAASGRDQLVLLDAHEMLAGFMVAGMPDELRFDATVGALIRHRLEHANGVGLRAYAEMVDLLWKDGRREAAIRLEDYWHRLADRHALSLLCAYAMGNFYGEKGRRPSIEDVCQTHTHVTPPRAHADPADDEQRRLALTVLERRVRALEAEIEHRRQLEGALRTALHSRARVETALRETEQELRDFLENAVDGMHWVGGDGTILWANAAELAMLGYSREEYIGRHIAEFHADRTAIDNILGGLWRNETVRNFPATMRCKDGTHRDVLINSSAFWRDGEFVHTRCITRDVTEQQRASVQRERATQHLAAEHAVTRLLADAQPFNDVVPQLLETIGRVGDWQVGALWTVDAARRTLHGAAFWQTPDRDLGEFAVNTRSRAFAHGEGMPGRTWATGEPVWIEDLAVDTNFPRAALAAQAGLQSAVAFPIRVRGQIAAVLEFFGASVRPADRDLLLLLTSVGTQVGHFIERRDTDEVRDRLAAIVSSSDDAIVSKTLEGVITSWNRGAQDIFGYTAAEAVGRHISLIIPTELRSEEDLVLARLRKGERIEHYETVRQTKDGRRLNISLTVSPVRNSAGQVIGASKVARDVTERKMAAAALAESETRFKMLNRVGAAVASSLDRSSIVQTVTDLAREVTTAQFGAFFYNVVDPQAGDACRLYTLSGAPKEAFDAFLQPRATTLFGPTFRGEGIVRVDDVTEDPRYGRSAAYHGMPAGSLPVRSYLAVPVRARSGDVLGGLIFGHAAVGVFTEQHEQMVEGIAAWASIALENARLHADTERAVQARDEFLSVASHELRNPLNALQLQLVGMQRAALERGGPQPKEWLCKSVDKATEDVGTRVRLVHNLLDVARITAGRVDLEPEDLDFSSVVRTVVNRFRQQLADRGLELDLTPVLGRSDRLRFEQVVTNLISNAIKYGKDKPVEVSLRADPTTVYLSVTDHGIGISPEQQQKLFERFSRAVPRREYGGFGLGLWIARETARSMGGEVTLQSEPGEGSTFSVTVKRHV